MPIDLLHRAIRDAYRSAMKRRDDPSAAFEECVGRLRRERPSWSDADICRAVARMLSEEPNP